MNQQQLLNYMQSIFKQLVKPFRKQLTSDSIIPKIINVIAAVALLVLAHKSGSFLQSFTKTKLSESQSNKNESDRKNIEMIINIVSESVYWVIIVISFLIVLNLFGVQTASIIAVLSTVGLAIGLAAQGILTNIVTGILITLFKAFSIGDVIEVDNRVVRVKSFNLVTTEVEELPTGVTLIIPNGVMKSAIWVNHTKMPTRNHVFHVLVSNKIVDLQTIIDTIHVALKNDPNVQTDTEPTIGVSAMDNIGTQIEIVVPILSKDYPDVILPIQTNVRDALVKKKIELLDNRSV